MVEDSCFIVPNLFICLSMLYVVSVPHLKLRVFICVIVNGVPMFINNVICWKCPCVRLTFIHRFLDEKKTVRVINIE